MLVVDQLKKDDPQLRTLAVIVFCGMIILFVGLWWVQLVSTKHFQQKLEIQSVRTVRIPAVRGKILDREGRSFAENRPSYNIDLYMEDLSTNFQAAYASALSATKANLNSQIATREKQLGRKLTPQERKQFALTQTLKDQLQNQARYQVVSNLVANLGSRLQEPISLPEKYFQTKYAKARALPMPITNSLSPIQLARFEEQSAAEPGMDLEVQSLRYYPNGTIGAHVLGYLAHNYDSSDTETASYNYRLPDYEGRSGLEGLFDSELRGTAGEKSVVVNYLGYRQSENVFLPAEPGNNVILTLDMDVQKAADEALQEAQANVRGAIVVMDAQNGDVLAMASAPNFNPNHLIHPDPDPAIREKDADRWSDETLGVQKNRAMYENYHPGSIFKILTGMAALEDKAFDPTTNFNSLGYYMIGKRRIDDTAKAGLFDFNRAMAKSSNPYFIDLGLRPGVLQKMIAIGQRLHLGERTGIMPGQEARGNFLTLKQVCSDWHPGDTANVSIGQGVIDVTPIQMAVMTAAVANGGKVLWPRLVSRIEAPDGTVITNFPQGRVRDYLGVSRRTLDTVYGGMLADVESEEGSGHGVAVPGWRIAGKTGTAEVERRVGDKFEKDKSLKNTWFVSFAPFENPKYVVVATVEGGISGARTCVPIVHKIYLALQDSEKHAQSKPASKGRTLAEVP